MELSKADLCKILSWFDCAEFESQYNIDDVKLAVKIAETINYEKTDMIDRWKRDIREIEEILSKDNKEAYVS